MVAEEGVVVAVAVAGVSTTWAETEYTELTSFPCSKGGGGGGSTSRFCMSSDHQLTPSLFRLSASSPSAVLRVSTGVKFLISYQSSLLILDPGLCPFTASTPPLLDAVVVQCPQSSIEYYLGTQKEVLLRLSEHSDPRACLGAVGERPDS